MLLLLRTATGNPVAAWALSAAVLLWFTTTWFVLPQIVLRRTAARQAVPSAHGGPGADDHPSR
ncbi:hypothetical protein [Kitasatospora sp. NPDC098663]|uniref:hypothetical protein n=1 Tax=Kitasatospora sp. NPDC098663 TaxID=3364096 RepID=UPI0038140CC0